MFRVFSISPEFSREIAANLAARLRKALGGTALISCLAVGSGGLTFYCGLAEAKSESEKDIDREQDAPTSIEIVERYASGKTKRAHLSADTTIQGVPYRAGTDLSFHENGRIGRGTLATATTIQGTTHNAGEKIDYDEKGKVIVYTYAFPQFSKDGNRLESATLLIDADIQGRRYKAGTVVAFHRSGKISSGTLAANTTIRGCTYKAGAQLQYDEKGNVRTENGIDRADLSHLLTLTGTIAETSIGQELQMTGSLGGISPAATMGRPQLVLQLKEYPGVEYQMTLEDAERSGLVTLTKVDDSGALQHAQSLPANGSRVKVYYRKKGKSNQAIAVKRLAVEKGSKTR